MEIGRDVTEIGDTMRYTAGRCHRRMLHVHLYTYRYEYLDLTSIYLNLENNYLIFDLFVSWTLERRQMGATDGGSRQT